ncbi:MAG: hypothetical protein WCJ57_00300 [Candidatus Falkowbacteria bacterium]
MNRRQYIITASVALVVVILAIWLGLRFFSNKAETPTTPNDNQAVSAEKTTYKDRLSMLKDLFSKKTGKTTNDIVINISREDNTHIKGIVTVKDVYNGVFLAARTNGEWAIIWDGNGKYPCNDIKDYNFPAEMVNDCLK